MPYVVVYTDKGEQVWQSPATAYSLRSASCPHNTIGSSLVAGLRRAVEDAEALEDGRDPERPSERAMRMSEPGWNLAAYTKRHMANLTKTGRTTEVFRQGDQKDEQRARSRIQNAARRLDLKVQTRVEGGIVIGTVHPSEGADL
jgi:hypothetical protein